ncbi:nitrate reductase cytochrome c-type subunit [Uliginosibacterium sp. H3]|uniref:Periplasmic nitrate reductase, electron transfer subunit n=1 Tax=Uliginosibacterium silvisoli TaxID=3114758 RepID=A0ABU6JZM9_9RHOO|nr:nitrate reductase cytochrome c-type subunit [Uliginosibacterium sp. H3]
MQARTLIALLCLVTSALAMAQTVPFYDPARGVTPIADEAKPPPIGNEENRDIRRTRAYSMQPPTIPHKIDNYRVDKNFNQCMFCHARSRAEETQAVPLSVTHYMDRQGNVLAEVSPRRYFCQQCHVPQMDVKLVVPSNFEDIDTVLRQSRQSSSSKKK